MATTTYLNSGPIYLTTAKYEEKKAAGELESGREYRIIDWEAQEKLTDDELSAVDSGITAVKVSQYDDYESTKQNAIYEKDTVVTKTVGGLVQNFNLKGHTIENILERLVGSYTPPSFTDSSLSTVYSVSNTRSGATSYLMGDTVQLNNVVLSLSKGTDFSSLVSGTIKYNSTTAYILTSDDLNTLSTLGSLTITLSDVSYTFPADQTSGNVTFTSNIIYGKKSYDANDQVIVTNIAFGTDSRKVSAADSVVYTKLYYGTIPNDTIISGLEPDGTVTYTGGTETFSRTSIIGTIQIVATDSKGQAAFIVERELNDIKFMTNSDIANWTKTSQTVSYTRDNGTSYSKLFYIYTNTIASGTFTYVLE